MFCTKCGANNLDEAQFCHACGQLLRPLPVIETPVVALIYAGFWQRLAALFIDGLIVGIATLLFGVLLLILGISGGQGIGAMLGLMLLFYVAAFVISAAYFTLLESSEIGATYGKRILTIRVSDVEGKRISSARALGRWAAHWITNCTFYVGYLIQPFTDKRQALHDMVSGTVVVVAAEQKGRSAGAVIAVMVGLLLSIVLLAALSVALMSSDESEPSHGRVATMFESETHPAAFMIHAAG